jgi:hypothetical protein
MNPRCRQLKKHQLSAVGGQDAYLSTKQAKISPEYDFRARLRHLALLHIGSWIEIAHGEVVILRAGSTLSNGSMTRLESCHQDMSAYAIICHHLVRLSGFE